MGPRSRGKGLSVWDTGDQCTFCEVQELRKNRSQCMENGSQIMWNGFQSVWIGRETYLETK